VREYLLETSRTAARTADECAEQILGATAAIVESLRDGGKILLCGNGGSAGDAQHLATEFVSTLTIDRRRDAIALPAQQKAPWLTLRAFQRRLDIWREQDTPEASIEGYSQCRRGADDIHYHIDNATASIRIALNEGRDKRDVNLKQSHLVLP
jgi:hypothetical protein